MIKPKISCVYLDMDGVIADFVKRYREMYGMDPREAEKKKEAKEEELVKKEQAKLQPEPAKVKPLKQTAKKESKRSVSEVVEEALEEDLYEEPEIELLGGPFEDVYLSRGEVANPSTTETVSTELKQHFPSLGRVKIHDSVDALI